MQRYHGVVSVERGKARLEAGFQLGREIDLRHHDQYLAAAGKLRVEHRQASLEELGRLAEPQMTKDAVAGRIRRLLSMADRKAKQDGIPDTESAVTPDLLEDA